MKTLAALAVLAVLLLFPAVTAAIVAIVGAVAVAIAAQPALIGFTAGMVAGPRLARHVRGWQR